MHVYFISDITKHPTQSYHTASSLDSSEYKNHSYRIIHGNLSWYQAQKACLEKGAALVSITDPFQQAYLTVLINRLEAPHWIGLYSTDVRRLWNHTVMMGYICVLNKSALYLHRMVSHTSGRMAVSFPSLTGKCLIITQRGPWEMEAACPWIVTDGGKTLNVTCSYQERYVTYLPRVSLLIHLINCK